MAGTRNSESQMQSLVSRNSHSSGEKDKCTAVCESVLSAKMEPPLTQAGGGGEGQMKGLKEDVSGKSC